MPVSHRHSSLSVYMPRYGDRVMKGASLLVLWASSIWLTAASAAAQPSDGISGRADLRRILKQCWTAPPGTRGSLIAFQITIGRDGELRAPPRMIASNLTGDEDAQERYRSAAREALDRCFPLKVTDASRPVLMRAPFTVRFVNTRPEPARQYKRYITIFNEAAE